MKYPKTSKEFEAVMGRAPATVWNLAPADTTPQPALEVGVFDDDETTSFSHLAIISLGTAKPDPESTGWVFAYHNRITGERRTKVLPSEYCAETWCTDCDGYLAFCPCEVT